jgi:nicotinamide-nucleotide amidase
MTEKMEKVAEEIGQLLMQRGLMLTTAESCTGGGLSYVITEVPGSSDWFERGFVTYSNAAKIDMLGVKQATLETFGAVSEQTAREMAEGALSHSQATISIAVTGIAGPTGGSVEKPVGTVWIAWATPSHPTQTVHCLFTGDRRTIRTRTIERALTGLVVLIKSL